MKVFLTPSGQSICKVVNKLFKIFLYEVYDVWAITSPINPTSGAPLTPTRYQVASWVVQAWNWITEELCAKAWTSCVYKEKKELEGDK